MDNIKDDAYYLKLLLEDVKIIMEYSQDVEYEEFINDTKLIDAILFRLIQISEDIKKISLDFKNDHKEISWNEIVGFRNRIVHEYGKTDYSIVYEVVKNDIPYLNEILGNIEDANN